jgi:8-oxo-dGTP diphosphatase
MGKTTRAPILAAGGIVIRHDGKPRLAVVQRRRDKAWVLPKGKLKPNEKPIAAAKREVMEETGCDVRVYEFLGLISHPGGSGSKITHFWRMQAIGDSTGRLMSDVKAVEWLPISAAIDRLSLPHEQSFLRQVGPHALRRALGKAPVRQPMPTIAEAPVDQGPPSIVPDAAPVRSRSQSGWHVLAGLIRRLLGQQSSAA